MGDFVTLNEDTTTESGDWTVNMIYVLISAATATFVE